MALMLSKNPNITPAEICEILQMTAFPLSETKSNIYGAGRINALQAVTAVEVPNLPLQIFFDALIINDQDENNDSRLNPGETVYLTLSLISKEIKTKKL